MERSKPDLGKIVMSGGRKHVTTEEEPEPGDLVLAFDRLTGCDRVWIYKPAPCPLPYWGNPKLCRKLTLMED